MDFEQYVAARSAGLLGLARVLTGDHHQAEDLVQSALADAFRHWSRVSRVEHPDAYVRRVLVNRFLRSRRRRWWGEEPTARLPERPAPGAGVDADLVARDELRWALAGLSPRARTVLVLRYYLELDDQAIADLFGVGVSTIRATASRALASLRNSAPMGERERTGGAADGASSDRGGVAGVGDG